MIRYLWLNVFIALWTIIMSAYGILISAFDRTGRIVHFRCAAPWARVILRVCGIRVRVNGLENTEADAPRIYMTNHQSFFDIFALLAFLPVNFKFILKQELMKLPVFGPAMKRAGYIGIERGDPRKAVKSMNQAAQRIRSGASVLIFPEGTRSPDGRLGQFKKGGFSLAVKSGCHIVPVAISGSHRIAPKGSLRIRKGTFSLAVGEPISLQGCTKREIPRLMDQVRGAMLRLMEKKGAQADGRPESGLKKALGVVLLITALFLGGPEVSSAYVMPVDQLIDKMGANFSRFKTLLIDQSTHVLDPEDENTGLVFGERVWIKSPGYCRTEITSGPKGKDMGQVPGSSPVPAPEVEQDAPGAAGLWKNPDVAFRRLLIGTDRNSMITFLVQMGVNLESVAFTRIDGFIAYRVGDMGPASPRLLIHKETFLPILFSYVPPGSPGQGMVVVRYKRYKKVGSGWYPYEIDYSMGEEGLERYLVLTIKVNVPMETSFFNAVKEQVRVPPKSGSDQHIKEEERLDEIIRVLKEKYGN
ncbi:MAG: 1-acyl-sn-glycerol-3-phosphate acyltransferase [Deltaproteobacteria bacterium]|nr:1-acyl-sn-glycerol-3-phosphate acyltransferase [Deltaproteobacteria bacterium]